VSAIFWILFDRSKSITPPEPWAAKIVIHFAAQISSTKQEML
jgi:hypothetical protein